MFQKGNIVFAATNQKNERLGERLVRAGKLKRSDLDLAFRVMERSNERIGRTVVDLGWLSPMEMQRFVATQIQDIVYSVFSWNEGHYRFEPSESDVTEELPLQIKTAEVIHEGARRISDFDAICAGIGRRDRALAFSGGKKLSIPVTLDDGHILSKVDGIRTIDEIVAASPLSEEDSLRRVYALLLAEVLIARNPDGSVDSGDDATASVRSRERQFRGSVKARHAALPLGDLYDRLGVDFGASEGQIRDGFEGAMAALEPEVAYRRDVADLEELLTTLKIKIREAYEILSVSETRARYDREFAHAAPGSTLAGEPGSLTEDTAAATEDDESARAELEYLEAQRLFDNGDYFDAVAALSVAVRLDPDNGYYHRQLGLWLSQNPGCWDTAEVHLEKAIAIDAEDVEARLGLAELHEDSEESDRADQLYREVLRIEPSNITAREKLASHAS